VEADVLLLNEIGLDPGIDHCSAIKLCNEIHAAGKRVTSFVSFCGGLPAPESADVPLGYKFSWSPRGVLAAALNGAAFKLGGKVGLPSSYRSLPRVADGGIGVEDPGKGGVEASFPGRTSVEHAEVRGNCESG
jgi:hypothetical protein